MNSEQPLVPSTPVFLLEATREHTQGRTCLLENLLKMLQGLLGKKKKKSALGPKWNILKNKELLTIRKKWIILPAQKPFWKDSLSPKPCLDNAAMKTASNLNSQLFKIKTIEEGTGCTPCI